MTVLSCVNARHDVEMEFTEGIVYVQISQQATLQTGDSRQQVFRCHTCGYGCRVGRKLARRTMLAAMQGGKK